MNTKIKKLISISILFVLQLVFSSGYVSAASLSVSSTIATGQIGDRYKVDLVIDTENESINAIEGKLLFPVDLLEFEETRDGYSIVPLWVEKPESENLGEIKFAGMIPGGYNGKSGALFSVIFKIKSYGEGKITFSDDIKLLLNDGKGTMTKVTRTDKIVKTTSDSAQSTLEEIKDITPPEDFLVTIISIKDYGDTSLFAVFSTTDKGVGIEKFEILESSNDNTNSNNWVERSSPYKLKNQHSNGYLFVKAIDKSGNKKITMTKLRSDGKSKQTVLILGTLTALLSVVAMFETLRWLRRKQKH